MTNCEMCGGNGYLYTLDGDAMAPCPICSPEPNAETVAAMQEADAGGGETFHGTTEEAFAKILAEDDAGTDGQTPLTTTGDSK